MEYNKNIKCPQCGTEIDPQVVDNSEDEGTKNSLLKPFNTEERINPESFLKILWLKKFELWILIVLFISLIVLGSDRLLTGTIHLGIDIFYIMGYIIFTVGTLKDKKFITLADVIAAMLKALLWPVIFCVYYTIKSSDRLENKESLYRIILYVNNPQKNNKEVS